MRRWFLVVLLLGLGGGGCDRRSPQSPSTGPKRVASLVPAATEMLLEIGARDSLVAVSNYDSAPEVAGLPRVGDYQSTEWETLAGLRPDAMIIQAAANHVPPGLRQRADQLGIELVNVRINRLDDIYAAMVQLGEAAGRADAARNAAAELRARLETIRVQCAARRPVRVLLVRDADAREVIGPGNFLDDLLAAVHATNAAAGLANPYPSIDRETLANLAPEVIIALLPDARLQDRQRLDRFAESMPEVPAVASKKVFVITSRSALLPGPRIVDLARNIARCLTESPASDKTMP